MSTELAVVTDMGMSMAEAMGISLGGTTVSMPRLSIIHTPIMGTMDIGGKKVKTEVVPSGCYKYTPNADTTIYCAAPEIRIFAMRQQWTKWDNDAEKMLRTVMANDLKGDLKDNRGGFNIGRPGGYIADFNALPQDQKDIIRSVKRTKNVFGMVTLHGAMNEAGEPVEGYDDPMPFAMDMKNTDSIKALDAAIKVLGRKNLLPIQHTLVLGANENTLPTGNTFATSTFAAGDNTGLLPGDDDLLRNFFDYIEYMNCKVLDAWADANTDSGLTAEEIDIVHDFVNVEEAD
jgi:hypothetical protein